VHSDDSTSHDKTDSAQPEPSHGFTHDVFISHSSKDKSLADAACAAIESRGLRCWVAPRDIPPGANWGEAIIDGLNTSRSLVLILSSHSNVSPQVLREVERAVSKGIPVIPLRTEDSPLSKSLEYFISSAHWLDAINPPIQRHLSALADRLVSLVQAPPPKHASANGDTTLAPSLRHGTPRQSPALWLVAGIGGVAVAALLILSIAVLLASRPSPPSPQVDQASLATSATPWIGLEVADIPAPNLAFYGATNGGVMVTHVYPGGPSFKAGVRSSDLLIGFDDVLVPTSSAYKSLGIESLPIGSAHKLNVVRDGKPEQYNVTVLGKPDTTDASAHRPLPHEKRHSTSEKTVLAIAAEGDSILVVSGAEQDERKTITFLDISGTTRAPRVLAQTQGSFCGLDRAGELAITADPIGGPITLWNARSGKKIREWLGPDSEITGLGISAVHKVAVVATKEEVILYDMNDGTKTTSFAGGTYYDKTQVYFGEIKRGIKKNTFCTFGGHYKVGSGCVLGLSPTEQYVALNNGGDRTDGCGISVYELSSGKAVWRLFPEGNGSQIKNGEICPGSLSNDWTRVAVLHSNGPSSEIRVYAVPTLERVATIDAGRLIVFNQISWYADRYLACTGKFGGVTVWDTDTGSRLWDVSLVELGDVLKDSLFRWGPQTPRSCRFSGDHGSLWTGVLSLRELEVPPLRSAVAMPVDRGREPYVFPPFKEMGGLPDKANETPSRDASSSASMTMNLARADGSSREITTYGDGSKMISDRDRANKVTRRSFSPGSDTGQIGVVLGPASSEEKASDGWFVLKGVRIEGLLDNVHALNETTLETGDIITAIAEQNDAEFVSLAGLHYADVLRLFTGQDETSVRLRILRGGSTEPIEVVTRRRKLLPIKRQQVPATQKVQPRSSLQENPFDD
jgi:S1-C subfamily serine protease